MEYIGLLEYGLKFGENFLLPKKRKSKTATEKKVCTFVFTITKIIFQLFLLVSIAELLEVYDKKSKSRQIFLNSINGGETPIGLVLAILTAPTVKYHLKSRHGSDFSMPPKNGKKK